MKWIFGGIVMNGQEKRFCGLYRCQDDVGPIIRCSRTLEAFFVASK